MDLPGLPPLLILLQLCQLPVSCLQQASLQHIKGVLDMARGAISYKAMSVSGMQAKPQMCR